MVKRYVDVNVFVYWLCAHPTFGEKARDWIEKIEKERGYMTSTLTLYETIVVVAGLTGRSLKDKEFVGTVVDSLTSLKGLRLEPLLKGDFVKATEMMDKFRLDFEDSLHLSVALRMGVDEMVSNDKNFDRCHVKRVF